MRSARAAIADPADRSERIAQTLKDLHAYEQAISIAFYVSVRDEVRTSAVLTSALDTAKKVSVPAVDGHSLKLYRITSFAELSRGAFGVLEPQPAIRTNVERLVLPRDVDVFVVPGLAFDRQGGRLGYGRGYYDRLLATAPQALKIGLSYDCQMSERIPMGPSDVRVDCVITESRVYSR